MSHNYCLRSYFICQFPGSGYFCTTRLLKQVKQISANKENFYRPNWVETFWKWKAKAIYDRKTLGKKGKTMSGNCNLFQSRKPNSIKHNLSQLQGCWRWLKLQSKNDHDLHSHEKWTMSSKVKSEVKKSVQHLKTLSWYMISRVL